jgi:hypothetical protein
MKYDADQWFPKWAVPPSGGTVGLPRGALEVGPSERVVRLFTFDQARAKHLPRFVFKVLPLLSLSKLFPLVTFVCIYDSELSKVTR